MRFEPEDIKLARESGGSVQDAQTLRHIERIDHTVSQMTKVWEAIQANLRYPWRQSK